MRNFAGFSSKKGFFSIPNQMVTEILPDMNDILELKILLHIFFVLYARKGNKYLTLAGLTNDYVLSNNLSLPYALLGEKLVSVLKLLVERGIIVQYSVKKGDTIEDLYFINNELNKNIISRIESGQLNIEGEVYLYQPAKTASQPQNIFSLYEKNIGLLTPIISEQLKEAEKIYPAAWIEEAFKEAVSRNKRSWRYIERVLERWAEGGKGDGEHREYTGKHEPVEKIFEGKYGHIIEH